MNQSDSFGKMRTGKVRKPYNPILYQCRIRMYNPFCWGIEGNTFNSGEKE